MKELSCVIVFDVFLMKRSLLQRQIKRMSLIRITTHRHNRDKERSNDHHSHSKTARLCYHPKTKYLKTENRMFKK